MDDIERFEVLASISSGFHDFCAHIFRKKWDLFFFLLIKCYGSVWYFIIFILYLYSSQYVYRSGNAGIKQVEYETHCSNYDRYIKRDLENGWKHLAIEYLDISHLLYDQPETKLESVVFDSLKLWLNKYLPLGIMPLSEFNRIAEILNDIDREIHGEKKENKIKELSKELSTLLFRGLEVI